MFVARFKEFYFLTQTEYFALAIAFALWPFLAIFMPKTREKRLYKHIRVVLCKKRLQKNSNIKKMRAF